VLGGVAFIFLIVLTTVILCFRSKRQRQRQRIDRTSSNFQGTTPVQPYQPYQNALPIQQHRIQHPLAVELDQQPRYELGQHRSTTKKP